MTKNTCRNEAEVTTRNTERTRCYNLDKYGELSFSFPNLCPSNLAVLSC